MIPRILKISNWRALVCMTPDLSLIVMALTQETFFFYWSFSHFPLFLKYLILQSTSCPSKSHFYSLKCAILSLYQFLFFWEGLSSSHYLNFHYSFCSYFLLSHSDRISYKERPVYLLMDMCFYGYNFLF